MSQPIIRWLDPAPVHVRWLGASNEDTAKIVVNKAHEVYDKCKQKQTQDKLAKEILKECMGSSVGAAADIVCGAYGVPPGVCSAVVGPVASAITGALYDAGVWLGLGNAEEEAKLHAEQAAQWAAWQIALAKAEEAHKIAEGALALAVSGLVEASGKVGRTVTATTVLERLRALGLELACIGPIQKVPTTKWGSTGDLLKPALKCTAYQVPPFWDSVCRASVTVSPESSSVDAEKVQSGAWKSDCKVAAQSYVLWLRTLTVAVEKYVIELSLSKMQDKPATATKKPSALKTVVVVGGVAALGWALFFRKWI